MKKILFCFFLLMSLNSMGQVTTGCFHIGGSEFEFVKAMVVTYDGNYVIGGVTYSYSSNYTDENFYVVKTDPSGNVLWSRTGIFELPILPFKHSSQPFSHRICKAAFGSAPLPSHF